MDVVVVGAGPAGLAVAACLSKRGIDHLLVERADTVASSWRRHYDRLHLHTSRSFSGLPDFPMPRDFPRYPSRDQVVAYLEAYCAHHALEPLLGIEVDRVMARGHDWTVRHVGGTVRCRHVVVATGVNGRPRRPSFPGGDSFPGPIVHSSEYRNGRPFEGTEVLVVGFGNSGGEIALDLVEHGALPTVSVRGPVNVIPRDVLGLPILALAIPLSRLPPPLADALSWPLLKLHYPSYRRLGLRKAKRGPFRQIAEARRIPLLDIGTIGQIRKRRIRVVPRIDRIDGSRVTFVDGRRLSFSGIVLATGYEPSVPAGLGVDATRETRREGIHYCGFFVSPTGMLREIGLEARRIAAEIDRSLDRDAGA